eukprot:7686461-Pyramimonas_sp.AAC.1
MELGETLTRGGSDGPRAPGTRGGGVTGPAGVVPNVGSRPVRPARALGDSPASHATGGYPSETPRQ